MSLCLAGKGHLQWRRTGLAVVALLRAVGIAVRGSADVARVVEPNPETPAAQTACRRRLLRLARVHAHTHETIMGTLAIKSLYHIVRRIDRDM